MNSFNNNKKEKGKEKGKEIERKILEKILNNSAITIKELSNTLTTTEKTIRYHINKLRNDGVIVREGSTKSGKWVIVKQKML